MSRRRLHRLLIALCAVLSLLGAQLALAVYVCPQDAGVDTMAARMAAGLPCEGMDPQQPALCHQHATPQAATFDALKLPAAAPPASVHVRVLPPVPAARPGRSVRALASSEARPPPDPLFLSTQRLRV